MRFSLKDIQGPFRRESGYPQSRPEIFRQLYDFDAMRFRLFAEKQDDVLAVVYTDGTGRHVRPVQKNGNPRPIFARDGILVGKSGARGRRSVGNGTKGSGQQSPCKIHLKSAAGII